MPNLYNKPAYSLLNNVSSTKFSSLLFSSKKGEGISDKGNTLSLMTLLEENGMLNKNNSNIPAYQENNLLNSLQARTDKTNNQSLYNSKSIVYSFDKKNNKLNLLFSTAESLLNSFFISLSSLISKPVFLIYHDKIIIKLLIYVSPIEDRNFQTSIVNKHLWSDINKIQEMSVLSSGTENPFSELKSFFNQNKNKLEKFSFILGKLFGKKIELNIIRLHFLFHDSTILSKILGSSNNSSKYKFSRMIQNLLPRAVIRNPSTRKNSVPIIKHVSEDEEISDRSNPGVTGFNLILDPNDLFKTSHLSSFKEVGGTGGNRLPSYLSGLSIRLGGRLLSQRIIPRYTVQFKQEGSLARGKVSFLESSRFTTKNKRGSYSFTINISHVI